MIKRIIALVFILSLCTLMLTNQALAASMFVPTDMIDAYNNTITPFFNALSDSKISSASSVLFWLTYDKSNSYGSSVTYTNYDNTIKVTFNGAYYTYSTASSVTVWTSLTGDYKNIPQMIFGYAILYKRLNGVQDMSFLKWILNGSDSSYFSSSKFFCFVDNKPYVSTTITYYPN